MNIELARGSVIGDADPVVRRACDFVRASFGIGRDEIEAALLFGSRAKTGWRAESDVDLIFIVSERSNHPDFSYQRLYCDAEKIDANVVKASYLNQLCQIDVGWSYRLHHAQPIWEFTRLPEAVLFAWAAKVDNFVESAVACRSRLLRHIRECRSLLRSVSSVDSDEPGIARYLMIEAVFLVPMIYLNARRVVPFRSGIPWDEAVREAAADTTAGSEYRTLVSLIIESELFSGLNRNGAFAQELKCLREECRTEVITRLGNVFRDGFGAQLCKLLHGDAGARHEILRLNSVSSESCWGLIDAIFSWLKLARIRRQDNEFPRGIKAAVRRRRDRAIETRFAHYDEETLRLKAIVPTGGCRVPTCTFCMLPSLAHSKSSVEKIIESIKSECRQRPLQQLTIYTDGSFFDRRELGQGERLLIAATARGLGARELMVESLPRFLDPQSIGEVVDSLGPECKLRLAVGVQSTDALVRRHITRTPITQFELQDLLKWRQTAPFALRLYLLANKLMMSPTEDRNDLRRSLQFLNRWLTDRDVVTINPLLPTHATVLERVWNAGCWRPLRCDEVIDLQREVRSGSYNYRVEFGPATSSTCSEIDLSSDGLHKADDGDKSLFETSRFTDANFVPWSVLGGLRHRSHWVTKGGLQFNSNAVTTI